MSDRDPVFGDRQRVLVRPELTPTHRLGGFRDLSEGQPEVCLSSFFVEERGDDLEGVLPVASVLPDLSAVREAEDTEAPIPIRFHLDIRTHISRLGLARVRPHPVFGGTPKADRVLPGEADQFDCHHAEPGDDGQGKESLDEPEDLL